MSRFCISNAVANPDRRGDTAILIASGEIDCSAAPTLRDNIHRQIALGARQVVLDLSGVTFIDSMAVGVILGAVTHLQAAGGTLAVACIESNTRVQRLLGIAGVASQIPLYHSREEVLAAPAAIESRLSERHARLHATLAYAQQAHAHRVIEVSASALSGSGEPRINKLA